MCIDMCMSSVVAVYPGSTYMHTYLCIYIYMFVCVLTCVCPPLLQCILEAVPTITQELRECNACCRMTYDLDYGS